LRIGAIQLRLGMRVSVNANACLYSFFDQSDATLHVDEAGKLFSETSFGGELGCPLALKHRYAPIKQRVAAFLRAYQQAGIPVDFIFADWEVDGPIEWNDAWTSSKRCRRCRREIPQIDDFGQFQKRLREIRSEMQRVALGDNVTHFFPEALVGNYGVYPHDGYRYWYDYFERFTPGAAFRQDQRARYRKWFPEFGLTGYTFAMPVVYTWHDIFDWYDFDEVDYRWFYNMLLVGSNAGRHTPPETPVIPFVHWTTTAPPDDFDRSARQFSEEKYQELLWHLLLRGHDTFFLWCVQNELAQEIQLVHEVYAAAGEYAGFLERGTPITHDVPSRPVPIISGLRLGNRVLVRRTNFGDANVGSIDWQLAAGDHLTVPAEPGNHVLEVQATDRTTHRTSGHLEINGVTRFPIGSYELPADDDALQMMAQRGINIVRCTSRDDLDRAQAAGVAGWVSLNIQQGATEPLRKRIGQLADHPALAAWEGPDEIVWTFTAYSGLAETAGYTRADWEDQTPKAVAYAEGQASKILPAMREGIRLVRQLDDRDRPFWINEAADSDMKYVRGFIDEIDVTGCDYYAVRSEGTDLQSAGRLVDRWSAIGRGKPVWMVLQGFSWHTSHPTRTRLYPSFIQSRLMAYASIVHGARGIFYWGSWTIDDPAFRRSLYALTAELAKLEPYLVAPQDEAVQVRVVDDLFDPPERNVRATLRPIRDDGLLILVNEDAHRHLGVEITGLDALEGHELKLLYGTETVRVRRGEIVTRLQGFEVKVFSTDPNLESPHRAGRDYQDGPSAGDDSPNKESQ